MEYVYLFDVKNINSIPELHKAWNSLPKFGQEKQHKAFKKRLDELQQEQQTGGLVQNS